MASTIEGFSADLRECLAAIGREAFKRDFFQGKPMSDKEQIRAAILRDLDQRPIVRVDCATYNRGFDSTGELQSWCGENGVNSHYSLLHQSFLLAKRMDDLPFRGQRISIDIHNGCVEVVTPSEETWRDRPSLL
jgi:hypothetical protein